MKLQKFAVLAASFGVPLCLHAVTLATWDFESGTTGSAPAGAGVFVAGAGEANSVVIVGDSSTPADPFASSGNQSLYITRPSAGSTGQAVAQFSLPSDTGILASGTISFDLYVVGNDSADGVIEIELGTLGTSDGSVTASERKNSVAALQFWTRSGSIRSYSGGIVAGNLSAFNQTLVLNAKNTVSISWDVTAGTYAVSINGTALTKGAGGSVVNSFGVTTAQAGVSDVRFTTNNANGAAFYVDNLTINGTPIPEPGNVAALIAAVSIAGSIACRHIRSTR
ncbi:MAG: hypothetical protein LBK99_27720 [Opitutaceae bacterium]|jgi:hypothetical protein|nr:hypothetical protein [Opitutaceae bacterium]